MREVESAPKGAGNSKAKDNIFLKSCTTLYWVNNWQWEESSTCQRESKRKFDIYISGKPFLQGNPLALPRGSSPLPLQKSLPTLQVQTAAENLPAGLKVCALAVVADVKDLVLIWGGREVAASSPACACWLPQSSTRGTHKSPLPSVLRILVLAVCYKIEKRHGRIQLILVPVPSSSEATVCLVIRVCTCCCLASNFFFFADHLWHCHQFACVLCLTCQHAVRIQMSQWETPPPWYADSARDRARIWQGGSC